MLYQEIISFETAKMAKEKGVYFFSDLFYYPDGEIEDVPHCMCNDLDVNPCSCGSDELRADYYKYYPAFTQSSLHGYLRNNHKIYICVYPASFGFLYEIMKENGTTLRLSEYEGDDLDSGAFTSYEKAYEHGLQKALEFI
ncbi:MAG: hypothetical protein ACOC2W_01910 [bacterium]